MRKSLKKDIYMNGKYLETCRNLEEAKMRVRNYERHDMYEIKVCGYLNAMPEYEIR